MRLAALKAERAFQGGSRPGSRNQNVKLLDGRLLEIDVNRLTLSEFQSLFTSEDNASFEKIVQEERNKLAIQRAWIEETALKHNEKNEETQ